MILHCLSSLYSKEVFTVKPMEREMKLIFFAVGSTGNSSDLVFAKNLENISKGKTEVY